jgi:RNA polymerase primary sigma factor
MFDTDFTNDNNILDREEETRAEEPTELSESSTEELTEWEARDVEALFSADLATTSVLSRAEEEVLARKIARARSRILAVLRRAKKLCRAALEDAGRGVILPEEDFRERETVTILRFAEQALRDREAFKRTGLKKKASLRAFIKDLTRALEDYRVLRDEMMRANLRLVNLFARRYRHPVLTSLDLFQEGAIGLLRAIEKYDPHRNIKFSTYATWWIWQQLSRAADMQGSLIRLPVHWNQFRRRIGRDARELAMENEGPVSREEIAASHGLDRERFEAMAQSFQFVSTDAPIGDDDDRTLESTLAAETPEPGELAEHSSLRERLEEALKKLPPREGKILRRRFGLDDDETETLEQLGKEFGVSRERIRQLEARGLKMLRAICAEQGLQDYLQ